MQLNYAVVHNLVKEAGTNEARTVLAEVLLSLDNTAVINLVNEIVKLIGQKENMAHYGVFRDDPASTRVPSIVKSYCMNAEPTPDGFLALTNDCMIALHDKAQSKNLATGGYLLFADYVNMGKRFLLVAMIKQRSGITMDRLVPTSITQPDLSKIHQVARVAFDRLRQYDEASAKQQDMTYIAFVSPKGNRRRRATSLRRWDASRGLRQQQRSGRWLPGPMISLTLANLFDLEDTKLEWN